MADPSRRSTDLWITAILRDPPPGSSLPSVSFSLGFYSRLPLSVAPQVERTAASATLMFGAECGASDGGHLFFSLLLQGRQMLIQLINVLMLSCRSYCIPQFHTALHIFDL